MKPTAKNAFPILCACEAFAFLSSGMTRFALLLWAQRKEGTATALALLGFSFCTTYVLTSPFAGVWIDRWDRRGVMLFARLGAACLAAVLLLLFLSGKLQIWHLYLAEGFSGALEAFRQPAVFSAVSLLVRRENYTRSNGLLAAAGSGAGILAPAIGGLLSQRRGLEAVIAASLAAIVLASLGQLFIRIPSAPPSSAGRQAEGSFRRQLLFGLSYIGQRPGLRTLLFTFFLVNLFGALAYFAVLPPMVLARSGGSESALALVSTFMGIGGLVGGLAVGLWAGSRRKAQTYLVSTILCFLVPDSLTAISRSAAGWALAGFLSELTVPFLVSPYVALWQDLVPLDVQGRVFASREMVQVTAQPLGYLAGGLLADRLFEPALRNGGALASALARVVGVGPGAGMAAMFLFTALLGSLTGLLGLLSPAIRRLESA